MVKQVDTWKLDQQMRDFAYDLFRVNQPDVKIGERFNAFIKSVEYKLYKLAFKTITRYV